LCKKPAANLDELRQRVAKYMQLEELREYRSQARAVAGGDKGKDKEKERLNRLVAGRGDRHKDNRGPHFTRYIPLRVNRGRILDEALSGDLISLPRRVASPENADRLRTCQYH